MSVHFGGRGPGHLSRSMGGAIAYNAAALSNWNAAVANRNSAPAVLVVMGNSIAEGFNSSGFGFRWIDKLRDALYAKYPVSGVTPPATSYVPAFRGNNTTAWTLLGAPTPTSFLNSFGLGQRAGVTATIGSGYEITMNCTSISLHYVRSVGGGDCKVEAFISGAYTTVGTFSTAGTLGSQVWNSGAFSGPATKLKITAATAANVYVEGVRFYNGDEAKGFHVIDASHFGYNIASYSGSGTTPYTPMAFVQPHLVIMPNIANDYSAQTVIATYVTSYQTTLASLRSIRAGQQVALMSYGARGDVVSPTIPYSSYANAQVTIAAADTAGPGSSSAVAYIPIYGRFPDCPTSPTPVLPQYDADRVHLTDTGHADLAALVVQYL